MMLKLFMVGVLTGLWACSQLSPSPESQIDKAAGVHISATRTANGLLERDRISVDQAKNFRAMLGSARDVLQTANKELKGCRARTKSSPTTSPDPCKTIGGDINLALETMSRVESALKAKEAE